MDDARALPKFSTPAQLQPFRYTGGTRKAKIAIVAEAWGEHEERFGHPMVWASGLELARMLQETGLVNRTPRYGASLEVSMIEFWGNSGFFLTNVFADRPPSNNLEFWCVPRSELPKDYHMPPIKPGKYIRPEYLGHLDRLYEELTTVRPNLIIACGNIACWALLQQTAISSIRGAIAWSETVACKVLPTYHPAVLPHGMWQLRTVIKADLLKAKREALFPEVRRPEREILVEPTLEEIYEWGQRPAAAYAVDIETYLGQITDIGFARSRSDAIVISFVKQERRFWPTAAAEVEVWKAVGSLLSAPIPKIFQNGLYDLSYLRRMGFKPRMCLEDTMLLHHSYFPELQKGLGFLGSIYSNEAAWKIMRHRKKDEKREE